jgi:hypothetical protein
MEAYYYELVRNDEIIGAIKVTGTEEDNPWKEIRASYPRSYDWLDSAEECRVGGLIDENVAICLGILSDDEVLEMIGRLEG